MARQALAHSRRAGTRPHRLRLPVPDRADPRPRPGTVVPPRLHDAGHADRRIHAAGRLRGDPARPAWPPVRRPTCAGHRPWADGGRAADQCSCRRAGGDRRRAQHRRGRRGGDDRAAEQGHRRLVPWPALHAGDQRLGRVLPNRRGARAAHPAAAGARVWLAGRLHLQCRRPGSARRAVPGKFPPCAACRAGSALILVSERARVPSAGDRGADLDRLYGRLYGLHVLRSVAHGGARREPGADRPRIDHRNLGECPGHDGRRPASPLALADSASSCWARWRWWSVSAAPHCWTGQFRWRC